MCVVLGVIIYDSVGKERVLSKKRSDEEYATVARELEVLGFL